MLCIPQGAICTKAGDGLFWGTVQGNFQSAYLVGEAVEDADAEVDATGRQVEMLGELEHGRVVGLRIFVSLEREWGGLPEGGDEFAVAAVGGDVEFERAGAGAAGAVGEGDLAWLQGIDEVEAGERRFTVFAGEGAQDG